MPISLIGFNTAEKHSDNALKYNSMYFRALFYWKRVMIIVSNKPFGRGAI